MRGMFLRQGFEGCLSGAQVGRDVLSQLPGLFARRLVRIRLERYENLPQVDPLRDAERIRILVIGLANLGVGRECRVEVALHHLIQVGLDENPLPGSAHQHRDGFVAIGAVRISRREHRLIERLLAHELGEVVLGLEDLRTLRFARHIQQFPQRRQVDARFERRLPAGVGLVDNRRCARTGVCRCQPTGAKGTEENKQCAEQHGADNGQESHCILVLAPVSRGSSMTQFNRRHCGPISRQVSAGARNRALERTRRRGKTY